MTKSICARLVLLLSVLWLQPHSVFASVYKFTADCSDCTGVVGYLTLQGYTPGMALTSGDFVSFVYSSSVFTPAITFTEASLSGEISAHGPADVTAYLYSPTDYFHNGLHNYIFNTQLTGLWSLGVDGSILDHGPTHNFALQTAVPEPSTWAMAILGFVGLALVASRGRFRRVCTA
ncbi:PEP-CTERM sorting domain-containing protein [Bradyrhizobium sp. INPA01-394B]|uniref:PEP-CTERM sorting domain-containing protein n=1 Tax=Bradyrhizobium campsiandrae TaxID=1729892 RepID=A0ABR7UJX8_9BRAD|nr:PEP-CTERM sorting domain-containing protein [Bradyrhizobium campsiandrae]MBC9882906.1 PEP-CTERM sorting domain-containing protein [Bradyrhizobium campsiandrae]MBC9984413.1 PEP-CTERM sorting domain-containing protein [Bradyrhizobium campsiandrae]